MKKLLVVGRGSPRDDDVLSGDKKIMVSGMSIDEYCHVHDIRVYHDPKTGGPITMSCHKTPELARDRAKELRSMVREGEYGIVAVLYGGMSFALPGIFSATARYVPTIAVPTGGRNFGGASSMLSSFDIPHGCAVACVGMRRTEYAVVSAVKMLGCEADHVTLVTAGEYDGFPEVQKELKALEVPYKLATWSDLRSGGTNQLVILAGNGRIIQGGAGFEVITTAASHGAAFYAVTGGETPETAEWLLAGPKNGLGSKDAYRGVEAICRAIPSVPIINGGQNAAMLAAQILGMRNIEVQAALRSHYDKMAEAKGYSAMPIDDKDFK